MTVEPGFGGQIFIPEMLPKIAALAEMIRFGFKEMDLNRIQLSIEPSNERSLRLVQRLGFKREGVLRDNSFFKGVFQDDVMFSLLRREWDEDIAPKR